MVMKVIGRFFSFFRHILTKVKSSDKHALIDPYRFSVYEVVAIEKRPFQLTTKAKYKFIVEYYIDYKLVVGEEHQPRRKIKDRLKVDGRFLLKEKL